MGIVKRLWLKPARKAPMKDVDSLELTIGGISGNAYKSKRRQVTILTDEAWNESIAEIGVDIDPSARRANVLVSGIDLDNSRGAVITIGGKRLLVGGEVTPCKKMEAVHAGLQKAMRPHWRGGAFARILDGGTIHTGDEVTLTRLAPTGSITYRRITEKEADTIASFRALAEPGVPGENRLGAYLRGASNPREALPPRVIYGAFDGNEWAGYIAGHQTTRYECDGELQQVYVAPRYRGTEVAHVLIRHLAVWFVERNARRVCVDVEPDNARARSYYAKHGAKPFKPSWMIWDDIAVAL